MKNRIMVFGLLLILLFIAGCSYEESNYDTENNNDTNGDNQSATTKLGILNHELKSETQYTVTSWFVEGTAKNTGTERIDYAQIKVRFFDEGGVLIENGIDNVVDLDPGMTFKFKVNFIGEVMEQDKPASYDISIEGLSY